MDERIAALTGKIKLLEGELELELTRKLAEFRVSLKDGKVKFEQEVLERQRLLKTTALRYIVDAHPLSIITAPFIYALIVPFVLLDIGVSVYQWICFPAYGIQKVRRGDYLIFDRARLAYLNIIEKVNCAYCSYGNGVLAYAREIAARTEQYWCPIKHARRVLGAHAHYSDFLAFGDAASYRKELEELRRKLSDLPGP